MAVMAPGQDWLAVANGRRRLCDRWLVLAALMSVTGGGLGVAAIAIELGVRVPAPSRPLVAGQMLTAPYGPGRPAAAGAPGRARLASVAEFSERGVDRAGSPAVPPLTVVITVDSGGQAQSLTVSSVPLTESAAGDSTTVLVGEVK